MKENMNLKTKIINDTSEIFALMYQFDFRSNFMVNLGRTKNNYRLFDMYDYLKDNNLILFNDNRDLNDMYSYISTVCEDILEQTDFKKKFKIIKKHLTKYFRRNVTVINIPFKKW